MRSSRLGQLMVQSDFLTPEQLNAAMQAGRRRYDILPEALVRLNTFGEDDLAEIIASLSGFPQMHIVDREVMPPEISHMSTEFMGRNACVPIKVENGKLLLAVVEPFLDHLREEAAFISGFQQIDFAITTLSEVQHVLEMFGGLETDLSEIIAMPLATEVSASRLEQRVGHDLSRDSDEAAAPAVKVLNHVFLDAIEKSVSDIHIEPYEKVLRVRYRMDGVLHDMMHLPYHFRLALVSRIKVLARLDIAEHRLPQDGRISLYLAEGKKMDLRVSILPTLFGEKVVMRLLDPESLQLDMSKLGYEAEDLALIKHAIHQPYGMVLVTGPTGSGKTVSLYSAVSELNQPERNISTVEDPVEFNFTGINQVPVHADIGLTFPAVLRSFLRQDPDVILIGEIRDHETAHIGIEAALTGHMVLATLHTNDAPSTLTRLVEMGIERFLVGSAINLVVAQRLARTNCAACAEEVHVPAEELMAAGVHADDAEDFTVMQGKGCPKCNGIGYKGRTGIYQLMPMDDELKHAVFQGKYANDIASMAQAKGMRTLRQAGLRKVRTGKISLAECLRVTAKS